MNDHGHRFSQPLTEIGSIPIQVVLTMAFSSSRRIVPKFTVNNHVCHYDFFKIRLIVHTYNVK